MDIDTWKFINTFAPWLSAVGTVAAVIVSLYLARRDKRIRLHVSAGHRLLITPGVSGPHPEYLSIRIVNIGHREAELTTIGWKAGIVKKRHALQTTILDGTSSPIPIRLKDGQEANYLIPLDKTNWVEDFIKKMLQPFPKIQSHFLKIQAFTSVGDKFEARIEKGLRMKIKEMLQKL